MQRADIAVIRVNGTGSTCISAGPPFWAGSGFKLAPAQARTLCQSSIDWLHGDCAGHRGEAARLPRVCPRALGYGLPPCNVISAS